LFPESGDIHIIISLLIESPDFLLCSHVHEAEGIEEIIGTTRVINVGKQGKIFDF
jgi:Icc-related predicted phosphoesterase